MNTLGSISPPGVKDPPPPLAERHELRGVIGRTARLALTGDGMSYEDGDPPRRYWLTGCPPGRGALGLVEARVAGRYHFDFANLLESICLDDFSNRLAPLDAELRWLIWRDLDRLGKAGVFLCFESNFWIGIDDEPTPPAGPSERVDVMLRGLSRPALRTVSRLAMLDKAELLIEEDR